MDKVIFFGVTGDKKLMFNNSLAAGSGMYLELNGKKFVMDPGPGTFNNFNKIYPGNICNIDGVILSHVHFDHSTDINAMIEGMTNGGKNKRGNLITLRDAYEGENRVIYNYLKSFPQNTYLVDKKAEIQVDDLLIEAVEHQHGIPNYGYKFKYKNSCISVITDTKYFDGLIKKYEESTAMIFNVPYFMAPEGKKIKHLCIEDVKKIIIKIKPQKVILTHFGYHIFEAGISETAAFLKRETGISVQTAEIEKEYMLI